VLPTLLPSDALGLTLKYSYTGNLPLANEGHHSSAINAGFDFLRWSRAGTAERPTFRQSSPRPVVISRGRNSIRRDT
jgi:hypothetical protein